MDGTILITGTETRLSRENHPGVDIMTKLTQDENEILMQKLRLQLSEELARTTNALPPGTIHKSSDFEHMIHLMLQEMGIEGLGHLDSLHIPAEDSVLEELNRYIDELHIQGKQILQDVLKNYTKKAKQIWNDLRDWDRSIPCVHEGCDEVVLKTRASNTEELWSKVYSLLEEIFQSFEIDQGVTDSVMNWETRTIDWKLFRGCVHGIITQKLNDSVKVSEDGKISVGHHKIDLTDFGTKEESFNKLELTAVEEINRKIASLCHFMNICSKNHLQCPSGHDLWSVTRNNDADKIYDFNYVSKAAIESCIRTIIGNAVSSVPKYLNGRVDGNQVSIFKGEIGGKGGSRSKHAIVESVLLSNIVNGDFEIPVANSDEVVQFTYDDNLVENRTFCAVNSKVVEDLTWKIKQLKPYAFFLLENEGKREWDHWAGNLACDILHAFNVNGFLIQDNRSNNFFYNDGTTPTNVTNLLSLKKDILDEIAKRFNAIGEDGKGFNALELLLNKDTIPPLFCLPLERPSSKLELYNVEKDNPKQGGYLNTRMQVRFPVISNNFVEDEFNIVRIEPSKMAIDSLNALQHTEWAVNEHIIPTVKQVMQIFVKERIQDLFVLEKKDDKYFLNMKSFPVLTLGQIRHWNSSFEFMDKLEDNFDQDNRSFFHAWNLDWRGRMYTCSTILDPQNDDFSRGLLRFAKSKKLDQEGWESLQRYTAGLMRGRDLDTTLFDTDDVEEWEKIQSLLKTKTFDSQLLVASSELFIKVLKTISDDPIRTMKIWAEDDVFKAKSEGFQRLSAIHAFVDAFEKGGVGADFDLPINQDASSSVYQFASLLVSDKEMAKLVNVIQDGDGPRDLYTEIVNDLESAWITEAPFQNLGLEDSTIEKVKKAILNRSIAKKPVMTISYGATRRNMIKSLLTHNGQNSGLLGGWIPMWDDLERKFTEIVNDDEINVEDKSSREWKWRMIAHPSCILNEALDGVDEKYHEAIAEEIITALLQCVRNKLPGFGMMMDSLKEIIRATEDDCVSWVLPDDTTIRNVKLKNAETKPIKAPVGLTSSYAALRSIIQNESNVEAIRASPDYMLQPIDWNNLPDLDSDLIAKLEESETERYTNLKRNLKDMKLTGKDLFVYRKSSSIKPNSELSTKELNKHVYKLWKDLDNDEKIAYQKMVDSLREIVTGDSVHDWDINWALFREINGLEKSNNPIPYKWVGAKLHPAIKRIINKFVGKAPCTFSRRILSGERNNRGESSGISPNFVHSHDACLMRLVVSELWRNGITDIWSVHDSFGCHPNNIMKIRELVTQYMKEVYEHGTLDGLIRKHLQDDMLEKYRIHYEFESEDIDGEYMIS